MRYIALLAYSNRCNFQPGFVQIRCIVSTGEENHGIRYLHDGRRGRPRDTALAEPSGAGAGAKARCPQTGDCVANVSARPCATL